MAGMSKEPRVTAALSFFDKSQKFSSLSPFNVAKMEISVILPGSSNLAYCLWLGQIGGVSTALVLVMDCRSLSHTTYLAARARVLIPFVSCGIFHHTGNLAFLCGLGLGPFVKVVTTLILAT